MGEVVPEQRETEEERRQDEVEPAERGGGERDERQDGRERQPGRGRVQGHGPDWPKPESK